MEASNSTTVAITSDIFLGAILTINNADKTDNGKEIKIAPNDVTKVFIIINPTPYKPISCLHCSPVKNSKKFC